MRQLTEQERKVCDEAYETYFEPIEYTIPKAFNAGFAAGLDYQQRKINTYQAYIDGKITLLELEDAIHNSQTETHPA